MFLSKETKKRAVALFCLYRRQKRRRKQFWVHPLQLLRPSMGEHLKVELMYSKNPIEFIQYTRMTPAQFDKVLSLIQDDTQMKNTNFRSSIPARQRLVVGLRYLATGDSFQTTATSFSMGKSTVKSIIEQVNPSIWKRLGPIYVKGPSKKEWDVIVEEFRKQWDFPNCLGAIDRKHVKIQAPVNSGSVFFNYKNYFSIVLLATCDADYRFTTIDIGDYGRQSDGGIFEASSLGKAIHDRTMDLPRIRKVPGSTLEQPCTFVGDDAFSLSEFMMKPFPQKGIDLKINPQKT